MRVAVVENGVVAVEEILAVEIEFDWDVLWPIGEIEVVEFWGSLG